MTEDEKRAAGMLFYAEDEALLAQKQKAHRLSKDYSDTYDTEAEKRTAILKELLGAMGDGVVMPGRPHHRPAGQHAAKARASGRRAAA